KAPSKGCLPDLKGHIESFTWADRFQGGTAQVLIIQTSHGVGTSLFPIFSNEMSGAPWRMRNSLSPGKYAVSAPTICRNERMALVAHSPYHPPEVYFFGA